MNLAETEHGLMLSVDQLKSKYLFVNPEHVSVEFRQEGISYQTVQFVPK
ncbi:hypothetical protein ACFLWG_04700 [Chloroflexota bacterium]